MPYRFLVTKVGSQDGRYLIISSDITPANNFFLDNKGCFLVFGSNKRRRNKPRFVWQSPDTLTVFTQPHGNNNQLRGNRFLESVAR